MATGYLRRGFAIACAMLAASTVVSAPSVRAVAGAETVPLRIMPLGDSITEGVDGYASYRRQLWKALEARGQAADFVGSVTGSRDASPYTDFDQHHEGHPGWLADEVLAWAGAWTAAAKPQIVLLHIGTNDLSHLQTVESTVQEISSIIDAIRGSSPTAHVALAKIIPSNFHVAETQQLNAGIGLLASQKDTPSSRVLVVDQWTGFDAVTDTYDGLHPNAAGEQKMAAKWDAAIATLAPSAPAVGSPPAPTPPQPPAGSIAVGAAANAGSTGLWLAHANGDVRTHGAAASFGNAADLRLNAPIVDIAATARADGYWLLGGDGGIFSFGNAPFRGSTGDMSLNQAVVSLASDPQGRGYWFVAGDGGIFSFGTPFFGSTGDMQLNQPVVSMATAPSGDGYWLVASDGGIFSFGAVSFYGSTGDIRLNQPIVGMATTPSGGGYWMVAADGGIFSFGDAQFHGSGVGSIAAGDRVTAMVSSASGGYWLITAGGTVLTFGSQGTSR